MVFYATETLPAALGSALDRLPAGSAYAR
jgi:hypothetical protein